MINMQPAWVIAVLKVLGLTLILTLRNPIMAPSEDEPVTPDGPQGLLLPTSEALSADSEGDVPSRSEVISKAPTLPANEPYLNELERSFVTLMVQHYMVHDSLPTVELAEEDYGFTSKEFHKFIRSVTVQDALESFGVNLSSYKTSLTTTQVDPVTGKSITVSVPVPVWQSKSLSALQLLTANVILDLVDTRSEKKKLQDLGVPTRTYNTWMRDPTFAGYILKRAELLLGDAQSKVYLALVDQATAGNIKAIEHYHELVGRYIKQPEKILGINQSFDSTGFIVRILEILDDEIEDKATAFRIADRLKHLASTYNAASQLNGSDVNPPVGHLAGSPPVGHLAGTQPNGIHGATVNEYGIEVPEIVATRELTGELKKLADKGVGVNE